MKVRVFMQMLYLKLSIRIMTSKASKGRKTIFRFTAAERLTAARRQIHRCNINSQLEKHAFNLYNALILSLACEEKESGHVRSMKEKFFLALQTHKITT